MKSSKLSIKLGESNQKDKLIKMENNSILKINEIFKNYWDD